MAPGALAAPLRRIADLTVRQLLRLADELGVAPATLFTMEADEPQVRSAINEELARLVGWTEEE